MIASLLFNGQTLVKGLGFDAWRSVGHPLQAINVFQMREVDEIIFLDITATKEGRRPNFSLVESLARECFVPLTIGGGVKSVEDVRDLLRAGADKVSAKTHHSIFYETAPIFGKQVAVWCYEMRGRFDPARGCRTGDDFCGCDLHVAGVQALDDFAGEVLLQSIPQDGTLQGYDIEAVRLFKDFPIPVIASGGAGTYEHMAQALEAGASAVAAGAMWLFTEQTPLEAKKYLAAKGYPVRL